MPTIAIIDDRREARETVAGLFHECVPDAVNVIDEQPLASLDSYPSWLREHNVSVLVIDERLHEQAPENGGVHVSYNGHDLVEYLRRRIPEFPIFVITSYATDEELVKRFGAVEDIIDRTDFGDNADAFAGRVTRAAQRYHNTFSRQLTEIAELATKVAADSATEAEMNRLRALQVEIGLSFPAEAYASRSKWIKEAERKIEEFTRLRGDLERIISKAKKK